MTPSRRIELVRALFACRYLHENALTEDECDEYAELHAMGAVDADKVKDKLVFSVKVVWGGLAPKRRAAG